MLQRAGGSRRTRICWVAFGCAVSITVAISENPDPRNLPKAEPVRLNTEEVEVKRMQFADVNKRKVDSWEYTPTPTRPKSRFHRGIIEVSVPNTTELVAVAYLVCKTSDGLPIKIQLTSDDFYDYGSTQSVGTAILSWDSSTFPYQHYIIAERYTIEVHVAAKTTDSYVTFRGRVWP